MSTKKFSSVYLMALVVLAGALIFAPAASVNADVSEPEVTLNDYTVGATGVQYTVVFDVYETLDSTDSIFVRFPSETYVPGSITNADVDLYENGAEETKKATVTSSVDTVEMGLNESISAGSTVKVVFQAGVGINNPDTAGTYQLEAKTTQESAWIASESYTISAQAASFDVSADTTTLTAGNEITLTITAQDSAGDDETNYVGDKKIFFRYNESQQSDIPYFRVLNFSAGEASTTFAMTQKRSGYKIQVVQDTNDDGPDNSDPSGKTSNVTVNPAGLDKLEVDDYSPSNVVAGSVLSTDLTVTAKDAYGNTKDNYTGTVSWSSNDSAAVLPADYTFEAADDGDYKFSANDFVLKTVKQSSGSATDTTLTVTDSSAGVSSKSVKVAVEPATPDSVVLSADPSTIRSDEVDESTITATVKDKFGNVVNGDHGGNNFDGDADFATSLGQFEGSGSDTDTDVGFSSGTADVTLEGLTDVTKGTATVEVDDLSDADFSPDPLGISATVDVTLGEFTGESASLNVSLPSGVTADNLRFLEAFTAKATLTNTTPAAVSGSSTGPGINGVDVMFELRYNDAATLAGDTVVSEATATTATVDSNKGVAKAELEAPSPAEYDSSSSLYLYAKFAGNAEYQMATADNSGSSSIALSTGQETLSVTPKAEWNMVSIDAVPMSSPTTPDTINRKPERVLGKSNSVALFGWDPEAGEYLQGNANSLYPDEGYWFFASSGLMSNSSPDMVMGEDEATKVAGDVANSLAKQSGWYMISAPFSVYLGDVEVEVLNDDGTVANSYADLSAASDAGVIGDTVWTWDNADEKYVKSTSPDGFISANKAYWIEKSSSKKVDLLYPYSPQSQKPSAAAMSLASQGFEPAEPGDEKPPAPPVMKKAEGSDLKATAAVSSSGVTFKVAGSNVQSMNVQVFSTNGKEIFADSAQGNSLSWNADNVANGLYLYGVSVKVNGEVKPLGIQKLLILQ